jgi:hypothetical protein
MECRSLKEIDIPDSVTYIGSAAFYGCTSLTTVKLPSFLQGMGKSMYGSSYNPFRNCPNLTTLTLNPKAPLRLLMKDYEF